IHTLFVLVYKISKVILKNQNISYMFLFSLIEDWFFVCRKQPKCLMSHDLHKFVLDLISKEGVPREIEAANCIMYKAVMGPHLMNGDLVSIEFQRNATELNLLCKFTFLWQLILKTRKEKGKTHWAAHIQSKQARFQGANISWPDLHNIFLTKGYFAQIQGQPLRTPHILAAGNLMILARTGSVEQIVSF
ncbi:hypothetical protein ACJX0J_028329, partial [Zea mays]